VIKIDTVYQTVLALANKEQRGYITPQEFNLFAEHAQNEIFEQYFYDTNQFKRVPGNQTEHADMITVLEDKIHPFIKETIYAPAYIGALPNNYYRPYRVLMYDFDFRSNAFMVSSLAEAEALQEAADRLDQTGEVFELVEGQIELIRARREYVEYVLKEQARIRQNIGELIPSQGGTVVEKITYQESIGYQDLPLISPTRTRPVYYIADHKVHFLPIPTIQELELRLINKLAVFTYIRRPKKPEWTYVVINEKALYNPSGGARDFELHRSEQKNLVNKILKLAGISIEDPGLVQAATQEEIKNIRQEKA
jgi:hypothetical protein